ncbi:MAG: NADH-quinone oxidoreductase subunit J [Verrucomicrobia bacterium]|nr:NADH-quinone oxidoreductase subunit J [Verrucomicrobiota bacterium]
MHDQLFWFFSIAMLLSGLLVILSRNPVNSAMFLVLAMFFMAGLFVVLEAYFLAIIQVLVYAGAVMVLFLFVIMFLDLKSEQRRRFRILSFGGGIVVAAAFLVKVHDVVEDMPLVAAKGVVGTTEAVGRLLFTHYLLPFEVTSVLLLVAMIGVVLLSKRDLK